MSAQAHWNELVGRTLLGTVRNPELPALPDSWERIEEPASPSARRLLDRLAALSAATRVGLVPEPTGEVPAPPEADPRPCAGQAACDFLQRLLEEDGAQGLLSEWLGLCLARGLRPPPSRIPALLRHALQDPSLREPVRDAAGPLLPWLAELDPTMRPLTEGPSDPELRWDSTETRLRVSALREIRATDPAKGLEMVKGIWKAEGAETRAELLEGLIVGLGPDDEAFLESCLDDRSRGVRGKAAEILAGLEGSACAARIAEALASAVRLSESKGVLGFGRKLAVEVNLPPVDDPQLERTLGIAANASKSAKPVPHTGGERAELLRLLVARSPLSTWQHPGRAPAEILAALFATDFLKEFLRGLEEATFRRQDPAWAELLLTVKGNNSSLLLPILSRTRRRALLLDLARKGDEPSQAALLAEPGPWDAAFTRDMHRVLREERTHYENHWQWSLPLNLAVQGDLAVLVETLPAWSSTDPSNRPGWIPRLIAHIELRHALHQAFAKDAPQ